MIRMSVYYIEMLVFVCSFIGDEVSSKSGAEEDLLEVKEEDEK